MRTDLDTLITVHVPVFFWKDGETSGQHFERIMFEVLRFKAETEANEPLWKPKKWREDRVKFHIQDTRGTVLDIKEGTDSLVDGIHVDWTDDYFGKKFRGGKIVHLPEISTDLKEDGMIVTVHYGLRYSNGHNGGTDFDEPVLVIGIGDDKYLDDQIAIITNNMEEVISKGRNRYVDIVYKDDANIGTSNG